jgi:ubiquinone biosynthesis protein
MRMRVSYRRFRRYHQIINILVRNGFGGLLESLKLRRAFGRRRQAIDGLPSTRAKRLRLALEELGPTFIKVGQMLSTRPDIVPLDIFQELQRLQDQVPPVDTAEILSEIESELKSSVEETFSDFDKKPMAAASIGQVHRARLKTGEKVAVKVQRPNIRKTIEEDIDILRTLARLAERHLPDAELYDPVGVVNEFARYIRQELDYTLEGRSMERFARNFADDDTVYIPKVYWNLTSGRVLTMEMIDGIKVSQVEKLRKSGFDTRRIAVKGAEIYLKQIFIHGFFHGDPHPGNIIVMPGEVIGLMDFGIVGRLSPEMATRLNNALIAIIRKDSVKITEELLQIDQVDEGADIDDLQRDMAELVDKYYGVSLNQFQVSELVREIGEISAKYRIRTNRQLSLLGKVLAGMEGVGRQLDPDFHIAPLMEPFVRSLIAQRMSPKEILRRSTQIAKDYADLIVALPQDLRVALEKARTGKLRIEFKHVGLENIVPELERSTSRLAFAMIIAALVVGSAVLVQSDVIPPLFGIPMGIVIGALGYLVAAISGFWLLITIIRNRSL